MLFQAQGLGGLGFFRIKGLGPPAPPSMPPATQSGKEPPCRQGGGREGG